MELKRCTRCEVERAVEAFSRRGRGRQSACRECARAARGRRGEEAPVRERIRALLREHLSTHPCVDCGESDPLVLEFDHVRGEKVEAVARLVGHRVAVHVIEAELAKCDVRCGNCHRRKTAREQNWWIWRASRARRRVTP